MNYKIKLNKISTFIFDVDGVISDGTVLLTADGEHVRQFHSRDRFAIQYAVKSGYNVFVITGGNSLLVEKSLRNLGVQEVILKASSKLSIYKDLKMKYNLSDEEIAYMGDDLPDLPVLREAGLSSCPADAANDIKPMVDYVSPKNGGCFAVRDLIEQTMKTQKRWMNDESAYAW